MLAESCLYPGEGNQSWSTWRDRMENTDPSRWQVYSLLYLRENLPLFGYDHSSSEHRCVFPILVPEEFGLFQKIINNYGSNRLCEWEVNI